MNFFDDGCLSQLGVANGGKELGEFAQARSMISWRGLSTMDFDALTTSSR